MPPKHHELQKLWSNEKPINKSGPAPKLVAKPPVTNTSETVPVDKPSTTETSSPKPVGKPATVDTLYWPAKCKQLDISLQDLSEQVSALRKQFLDSDGRTLNLQVLSQQIYALRQPIVGPSATHDGRESSEKDANAEQVKVGLACMQRVDQESLSAACEQFWSKWWTDQGDRIKKLESEIEVLSAVSRNSSDSCGKHAVDETRKEQQELLRSPNLVLDELSSILDAKVAALVEQALAKQTLSDSKVHECIEQALAKRTLPVDESSDARFSKLEAFVEEVVAKQIASIDSQVHRSIEQALSKLPPPLAEASEFGLSMPEDSVDRPIAKQAPSLDSQIHQCIEEVLAKRTLPLDEALEARFSKLEGLQAEARIVKLESSLGNIVGDIEELSKFSLEAEKATQTSSLEQQIQKRIEEVLAKQKLPSDEALEARFSKLESLQAEARIIKLESSLGNIVGDIEELSKITLEAEKATQTSSLEPQIQKLVEEALAKRILSIDEASEARFLKLETLQAEARLAHLESSLGNIAQEVKEARQTASFNAMPRETSALFDSQVTACVEKALAKRTLPLDEASELRFATLEGLVEKVASMASVDKEKQAVVPSDLKLAELIEQALAKRSLSLGEISEARFAKLEARLDEYVEQRATTRRLSDKRPSQRGKKTKRVQGDGHDDAPKVIGENNEMQQRRKPGNAVQTNVSSSSGEPLVAVAKPAPNTNKLRVVTNAMITFPKSKPKARNKDGKEATSPRPS